MSLERKPNGAIFIDGVQASYLDANRNIRNLFANQHTDGMEVYSAAIGGVGMKVHYMPSREYILSSSMGFGGLPGRDQFKKDILALMTELRANAYRQNTSCC